MNQNDWIIRDQGGHKKETEYSASKNDVCIFKSLTGREAQMWLFLHHRITVRIKQTYAQHQEPCMV